MTGVDSGRRQEAGSTTPRGCPPQLRPNSHFPLPPISPHAPLSACARLVGVRQLDSLNGREGERRRQAAGAAAAPVLLLHQLLKGVGDRGKR